MPLVRMDHLLRSAHVGRYAVAAFECWNSANIYAVATGAAAENMPVIFQASPVEYQAMGGADVLQHIVQKYVAKTGITAALHLDHGATLDQVRECLAAGFTSVMLDASIKPFVENLALSRQAAELAHSYGVGIEAELGHVAGCAEAGIAQATENGLTDPDEAAEFVEATGIDCLAVAIGTVHGAYHGEPQIHLDLLQRIAERVQVPLVLHGGSGTPPEILRRAIQMGIAKINICTDIHQAWLAGIDAARGTLTPSIPGAFYQPAQEQLQNKVREVINLFK